MKETLYGFVGTVGITQENGQTLVHDPLKPFLYRGAEMADAPRPAYEHLIHVLLRVRVRARATTS